MKQPFVPAKLPINLKNEEIIELLLLSNQVRPKIEKFNTLLKHSVISEQAMLHFSLKESIESTKIEGTQTTFTEIMEVGITGKNNNDTDEVHNYEEALAYGAMRLAYIPLSTRLFLELHNIILNNSRGRNRSPGEYRKVQNFIGSSNEMKDATYIPPEPHLINEYMSNLEKYINDEYEDNLDPLIRVAIMHAQFETIHPFLDGNGRLGRILIILYLLNKEIITFPSFFISEELEKNKFKYYGLLNNLRNDNPKWKDWIKFFLTAAIRQADKNIEKLEMIEDLYASLLEFGEEYGVRRDLITYIFKKPVFTVREIQDALGVSYNTASTHIRILADNNQVFPNDKTRNKIYTFYDLIDILNR